MNVWKVIVAALILYAAGVATGFMAPDAFFGESERDSRKFHSSRRPDMKQRLEQQLELREDQKEKFHSVYKAHHEQMISEFRRLRTEMRSQIQEILTEEQMAKYDQMSRWRRERSPGQSNGRERSRDRIHREHPSEGRPIPEPPPATTEESP